MRAIFYDRKNKREVANDQLVQAHVFESYAGVCDEGFGPGTPLKELIEKFGEEMVYISTRKVASLGYKSEKCPTYQNYDLMCNDSDLVFLRTEP